MKIKEVTDEYIKFDNGSIITYKHPDSTSVFNYADFNNLHEKSEIELAKKQEFNEPLEFEKEIFGFKFGNKPDKMFYVFCNFDQYEDKNEDLEIYYNKDLVLKIEDI